MWHISYAPTSFSIVNQMVFFDFTRRNTEWSGGRYIESTLFQIYYFSNFNVLKTAIGVFEGAESNEINFI